MNNKIDSDKKEHIEISWLLFSIVTSGLIAVGVLMFFVGLLVGGVIA